MLVPLMNATFMLPVTPSRRAMTTRNPLLGLGVAALLALSGCATPGPLHLYSVASGASAIGDATTGTPDIVADTPSYLAPDETLTGFAYDPFSDHFFLRLGSGNAIRVVDRPARKIKREFVVTGAPAASGDLAVSPKDGHLFLVNTNAPELIESTRLGKLVRAIRLEGETSAPAAVAYDEVHAELIALAADGRTLKRFTRQGKATGALLTLDHAVEGSLGYDSAAREYYAPLRGQAAVGAFNREGRLQRAHPVATPGMVIDVGPHSFLRVF